MNAVKQYDYKGREVEPGSPTAMFVEISAFEALREESERLALENEGHNQRRIRQGEEIKRLHAERAALRDGGRIAADINRLIGEYNAQVNWSGDSMAALIDSACAAADLLATVPNPKVADGWIAIFADGSWSDIQTEHKHALVLARDFDSELPPNHDGKTTSSVAPVFIASTPIPVAQPTEAEDEARHSAVKAIHDVMATVPCSSLYSLAEAVHDAGYALPVGILEPLGYAKITGTLDEIDAIAWPFINAEAAKVDPQYGRIEAYQYARANGGVIVLWNANRIHAVAVTIRDDRNCTRCVRMLASQDG